MDEGANEKLHTMGPAQAGRLDRHVDKEAAELNAQLLAQGIVIEHDHLFDDLTFKQVQTVRKTFDNYLKNKAASKRAASPRLSEAERAAYLSESLALARQLLAEAPERLAVTRSAAAEAAGVDMPVQGSAGQLITWVFAPLLGTSALFAFERSQGTLRCLLTTPTSKATYLLGTLGGQLALAMQGVTDLVSHGQSLAGIAPEAAVLAGFAAVFFAIGVWRFRYE